MENSSNPDPRDPKSCSTRFTPFGADLPSNSDCSRCDNSELGLSWTAEERRGLTYVLLGAQNLERSLSVATIWPQKENRKTWSIKQNLKCGILAPLSRLDSTRLASPSAIASCYVINYGSLRNRLKEPNTIVGETNSLLRWDGLGWARLGLYIIFSSTEPTNEPRRDKSSNGDA